MEENQSLYLDRQSPFTLFLILILLILSTEKDVENYLENARNFILETKRSAESIRTGLENFHTNMAAFHTKLLDMHKKY